MSDCIHPLSVALWGGIIGYAITDQPESWPVAKKYAWNGFLIGLAANAVCAVAHYESLPDYRKRIGWKKN